MQSLICLFILTTCAAFRGPHVSASHDHDWDVLIFTQHWPITVCMQWKEKLKEHTCILPKIRNIWTVHGIWPTKLGTIGPQFCNNSMHFDPAQLKPIEDQLEQYWLNIYNGTGNTLWKHEWKKHGTCAATLPALDNENKYFGQGLQWIDKYNMENVLSRAGINPDVKGYTPEQVWNAVKELLGKTPAVECIKDTKTGEWFLFEIRICFDKNLTLTDCDGIKGDFGIKSNCPIETSIMYPGSVPGEMLPKHEEPEPYRAPWLLTALRIIQWLQWITL